MSAINLKALDLLQIYTAHTFDIGRLAGDANKENRRQIMSALHGKRMPVSKAGIHAIQKHFYLMAGAALDGATCIRDRELKFAAWAKGESQIRRDEGGAGHEEGGVVWNAIHGIEEE